MNQLAYEVNFYVPQVVPVSLFSPSPSDCGTLLNYRCFDNITVVRIIVIRCPSSWPLLTLISRGCLISCRRGVTPGWSAYTKFRMVPRNLGSKITLGSANNTSFELYLKKWENSFWISENRMNKNKCGRAGMGNRQSKWANWITQSSAHWACSALDCNRFSIHNFLSLSLEPQWNSSSFLNSWLMVLCRIHKRVTWTLFNALIVINNLGYCDSYSVSVYPPPKFPGFRIINVVIFVAVLGTVKFDFLRVA